MIIGRTFKGLISLLAMVLAAPEGFAQSPDTIDDLQKVSSATFDEVFLLPGADFTPYTKVLIDKPEVAFKRNWLRDYNNSRRDLSSRISESEAQKILADARDGLSEVYAGAFGKVGYEVVAQSGPDVLRVRVSVINLTINAPDTISSGRSRSYAREAGRAKIIVEVRDSESGATLGRAVDSRRIGDTGYIMQRTSVSNRSDFEKAFKRWAELSVSGLEALKESTPVAEE